MRTAQATPAQQSLVDRLLPALAVVLFLAIPAVIIAIRYHGALIFWDAHTYANAIHSIQAGDNPYAPVPYFNFIYPPIFLHGASFLSRLFPFSSGWFLYLTLNLVAVFSIPVLLSKFYLRSTWLTVPLALGIFFFHPLFPAEIAFLSGNISNLLYALILAAGVPGLCRNRWLFFYLAVVIASLVKFPFFIFLLLPYLIGRNQKAWTILTFVSTALITLAEQFLYSQQYHAYIQSMFSQVVLHHDAGFGLLALFLRITDHFPWSTDLLILLAVALAVTGCLVLFRKRREAALPKGLWIATILLTAIVANPRMLTYDADIAILPATLIIVESIRSLLRRRTNPLLITLPIAIYAVLLTQRPHAAIFFFLLCALACGLARQPTQLDKPHPPPAPLQGVPS